MPSIPLIVDSTNAQNKNTLGNRCSISFSPPLKLPRNCSPSIRLYSASFAYNSPNVSAAFSNNVLTLDRMNMSGAYDHRHHETFAGSLYGSLDDIARVIRHSLHGDANFSNIEITFIPVEATQRVHIEVTNGNSDALMIHFSSPTSIGPLMGFTSDHSFLANATTMHESDTTAALDRTTSVLVQTSLCNGSIVGGGRRTGHAGNGSLGSVLTCFDRRVRTEQSA